ncbi:hypothetical protein OF846_000172 [Rhodotorula toruloides]|nr:hypothetical protein OF846_000172 [Rhodotorula toruloides]
MALLERNGPAVAVRGCRQASSSRAGGGSVLDNASSCWRADGQVQEPHQPQPEQEGSPQRYQEAQDQQVPLDEGCRPQVPPQRSLRCSGHPEGARCRAQGGCFGMSCAPPERVKGERWIRSLCSRAVMVVCNA